MSKSSEKYEKLRRVIFDGFLNKYAEEGKERYWSYDINRKLLTELIPECESKIRELVNYILENFDIKCKYRKIRRVKVVEKPREKEMIKLEEISHSPSKLLTLCTRSERWSITKSYKICTSKNCEESIDYYHLITREILERISNIIFEEAESLSKIAEEILKRKMKKRWWEYGLFAER